MAPKAKPKPKLIDLHCRLFAADVEQIKAIAADRGIPWQVELRLQVHAACEADPQRATVLLKETR